MSVSSIIMAGGEGSRLRPLTCDTPKPMVPVLGKPVLSYALQLLKRHNITNVGITLQYLPDRISKAFGSGTKEGVNLYYFREKEPLGTAGGVLQAAKGQHAPRDTFVILSGDGLTDCNLTDAITYHKQKKALATLVLKRVLEPLEYGVVLTDEDGRVVRFVEKPGWGEVYSDTVNTGIYLLEPEVLSYIWDSKPCDFGKDLFPMLVAEHKDIYAFETDAYWCDIGDQNAYVRAQGDFLQGNIKLDAGCLIAETALIDDTAVIDGPCFIGPGARIGANVRISDCAVIGRNVAVGPHARIARSVLWEDAAIHSHAQVRGAVVCRGAQVMQGAMIHEECALGDGAVLGARASQEMGAKVWPGKRIDPYVRVTENLVWDGALRPKLHAGSVDAFDPATACQLAAAFAVAINADRMALSHDGSAEAMALYTAATGALSAQGVVSVLLDMAMPPILRNMQRMRKIPAGIFFNGKHITFSVKDGGMPSRAIQRKIETLFIRQDFTRPFSGKVAKPLHEPHAEALYTGALAGGMQSKTSTMPHIAVFVERESHVHIIESMMLAAGISAKVCCGKATIDKWEMGFLLSNTLEKATVFDCYGTPDDAEQALLAYAALPASASEWVIKMDATAMIEWLAEQKQAKVKRISGSIEAFANGLLDEDSRQFDMHFDGLYQILSICSLLAVRRTTLRGILSTFPTLYRYEKKFPCALPERGRLLSTVAKDEMQAILNGGLRITREDGWLTVNPDEREPEMIVVGEAADMEIAKELCGELLDKLNRYRQHEDSK